MQEIVQEALNGHGLPISELIGATIASVVHLEMHDAYIPCDEAPLIG
jgi:hypothetical protein